MIVVVKLFMMKKIECNFFCSSVSNHFDNLRDVAAAVEPTPFFAAARLVMEDLEATLLCFFVATTF